MIGYDIYDCFTMEHFRLRQRMTLTIKIYCSRLYKRATEIETKGTSCPQYFTYCCNFSLYIYVRQKQLNHVHFWKLNSRMVVGILVQMAFIYDKLTVFL
jgi:hypothetical protein